MARKGVLAQPDVERLRELRELEAAAGRQLARHLSFGNRQQRVIEENERRRLLKSTITKIPNCIFCNRKNYSRSSFQNI